MNRRTSSCSVDGEDKMGVDEQACGLEGATGDLGGLGVRQRSHLEQRSRLCCWVVVGFGDVDGLSSDRKQKQEKKSTVVSMKIRKGKGQFLP